MKNLIRNSFIVFSVIIVTINIVDSIVLQSWNDFSLYLEIGSLSIIICLINYMADKFQSRYYILNIIIQFTLTLVLVLFFGYVFYWYRPQGIWLICATVVVAYIISFLLGALKIKKDVALINEKLKEKRKIHKSQIKIERKTYCE